MKKFKEQGWSKCEFKKPYKQMGLPKEPAVYLIVLRQPRRNIIYVGNSKSLYNRILSHQIIFRLKRNIPNIKLEIWYKNFRYISYQANDIEEAKLIAELKPAFNGSTGNTPKGSTRKATNFWKKMGVGEIKINYWHRIKVA